MVEHHGTKDSSFLSLSSLTSSSGASGDLDVAAAPKIRRSLRDEGEEGDEGQGMEMGIGMEISPSSGSGQSMEELLSFLLPDDGMRSGSVSMDSLLACLPFLVLSLLQFNSIQFNDKATSFRHEFTEEEEEEEEEEKI